MPKKKTKSESLPIAEVEKINAQNRLAKMLTEILHHSKKGLRKDERCEKKGVVLI